MKAPLPKTQDIELEGERYQVCRMNPLNGNWIVTQVFTRLLPSALEAKLASVMGGEISLPPNREQISEQEFHNLQAHCLAVCKWHDPKAGVPIPIMLPDGRFATPDLEDPVVILALTGHALLFNLAPFFVKSRLDSVMESFGWVKQMATDLGLKLPDTPLSTNSVSGQ